MRTVINWLTALAFTLAVIGGGVLVGGGLVAISAPGSEAVELSPADDYGIRHAAPRRDTLDRLSDYPLRHPTWTPPPLRPMDDYGIRHAR